MGNSAHPSDFAKLWLDTALNLAPLSGDRQAEQIRNGEALNWGYWLGRCEISPEDAAKLNHGIDPIKWPKKRHAQGPYRTELRERIDRMAGWLAERGQKFSLDVLVTLLGRDASLEMVRAVEWEGRYKAGRYRLNEAISLLAHETGERGDKLLNKLTTAITKRKIKVYEPGRNAEWLSDEVRDYHDEVYGADLNSWLTENEPRIAWRFPPPPSSGNGKKAMPRLPCNEGASSSHEWKVEARKLADECVARHKEKDLHPSLNDVSDEVAEKLRKANFFGPQGKPLSSATIKREVLQGEWWRRANARKMKK